MKNIFSKIAILAASVIAVSSCSDEWLTNLNTDPTKPQSINPNSLLTTGLLQTYGDFSMMDTYRCYITGFTQYYAGGWNVSNYAGAVHADNDMMSRMWDQLYSVGLKNIVAGIDMTKDVKPNLNAILRIHRVYLLSVLTDTYGDVPCKDAGLGMIDEVYSPAYDTQKDIYYWFFDELAACIKQIQENTVVDNVTGDVTAYNGDPAAWAAYANSLRMRFAMRISDVEPAKAQTEFENAVNSSAGFISDPSMNAYVKHIDAPFTLYDGARDLDFRVNALGEMLYGQDATSPTFVCHTLFYRMQTTNDPRLYCICRHYLNTKRSQIKADDEWNVDVTDEVVAYQTSAVAQEQKQAPGFACYVGAAWYSDWIEAAPMSYTPTLEYLDAIYPEAGFNASNFPVRMLRPSLSIKFEKGECPGILMTSAEVNFLLAEAASKGWSVPGGDVESYYSAGIYDAMHMINEYYVKDDAQNIKEAEILAYVAANPVGSTELEQREAINTQAWILHLTNPSEGWANLRRSDYPAMDDRSAYEIADFVADDPDNMTTPLRLKYPSLEAKYNSEQYNKVVERMGGKDDWHNPVWWDVNPTKVDHSFYVK